jgi:hypothetical protein
MPEQRQRKPGAGVHADPAVAHIHHHNEVQHLGVEALAGIKVGDGEGHMRDACESDPARGTSEDEQTAVAAYEAALIAHADASDTFETARTHLLYGARLRRSGQRVKAREQLRTAHDAFEEMDLTAWVLRAADELAATGAKPRARRPRQLSRSPPKRPG